MLVRLVCRASRPGMPARLGPASAGRACLPGKSPWHAGTTRSGTAGQACFAGRVALACRHDSVRHVLAGLACRASRPGMPARLGPARACRACLPGESPWHAGTTRSGTCWPGLLCRASRPGMPARLGPAGAARLAFRASRDQVSLRRASSACRRASSTSAASARPIARSRS